MPSEQQYECGPGHEVERVVQGGGGSAEERGHREDLDPVSGNSQATGSPDPRRGRSRARGSHNLFHFDSPRSSLSFCSASWFRGSSWIAFS